LRKSGKSTRKRRRRVKKMKDKNKGEEKDVRS
jgi:hypothetical protein